MIELGKDGKIYGRQINECHSCGKSLSLHKDVIRVEWGEGDYLGQIRNDSEVRFFCSLLCVRDNFHIIKKDRVPS